MAVYARTNAFAYVAGYDFTTDSNQHALACDVAALDATPFGESFVKQVGGLKSLTYNLSGFFQSAATDAPDPQAFNGLGSGQVYTVGEDLAEGSPAYMFQAMRSQYTLGGAVGEIAPFAVQAAGSDGVGVVRGKLTKSRGLVSATGAVGTPVELAAASSSQYVYCAFHVFSAGTTITAQLQSDVDADFASPTTVATIGPITTAGGTWMTRVAGPVTDTFYRINISAITGSFIIAAAVGVQ